MCTGSELNDEDRAKILEARKRAAERHAKRQQEREEKAAAAAERGESVNEEAPQEAPLSPPSEDPSETPKEKTPEKSEFHRFSLAKEFQHIKEFAAKYSGPRRERRRVAEDIAETKKKWASGELLKRKKAADPSGKKPVEEEVDLESMSPEERQAYEAKMEKEQEELAKLNATPLMHVGDTETVWEKRIASMKERLRRTWPAANWRALRRKAAVSDNPVLQQARDMRDDMADNVQDIKEFYGTTQHPVISRVRDGVDNVTGETETGWAIGEIRRVDPAFDIQLFLEDMEDYMIPLVIESFLKGDMHVMSSVMEEKAHGGAFSSCREREVLGHYWDPRILNVDHLDFQGASVENETPFVLFSFVCQHVHCIKDKKGVIVEGHPGEVKSVYYAWRLRRDFDNPDFDWKIVDMHYQRIFSLVG